MIKPLLAVALVAGATFAFPAHAQGRYYPPCNRTRTDHCTQLSEARNAPRHHYRPMLARRAWMPAVGGPYEPVARDWRDSQGYPICRSRADDECIQVEPWR